MNLYCKTCYSLCLFLIGVFIFWGCNSDNLSKINDEISTISQKYVTDRRTDISQIGAFEGLGDTIILRGETTVPELKTAIIKTLGEQGNKIKDSILIIPDTIANKRYLGLVNLSVTNLRKEPDHSSELVSQAIMGTPVMILKNDGSWALIRTPDRYISWTERSSLRLVTTGEMQEWKSSDRIVYEKNIGWIYSNIAETGIVSDLVSGCILARIGESGAYSRVVTPDGREGFVESSAIIPFDQFRQKNTEAGEDIINRASLLTGVPYLWGGSSSKGVDCSGFVQTVYFMNGLILARDASQQAQYGDQVDISQDFSALQSGDLLFFGSPQRISHVAIYRGDGEYIHSSGRVMVNSLDSTRSNYSSYRRGSFVKAMRIIKSADPGIVPVNEHPWY